MDLADRDKLILDLREQIEGIDGDVSRIKNKIMEGGNKYLKGAAHLLESYENTGGGKTQETEAFNSLITDLEHQIKQNGGNAVIRNRLRVEINRIRSMNK